MGANRLVLQSESSSEDGEDGILTSLEASALNLSGTVLVLSACQSGIGVVRNGEGVYGLRRAFQQAGAESIITSLYSVPDNSTLALINSFYDSWTSGKRKAAALRDI